MKRLLIALFVCSSLNGFAQNKSANIKTSGNREYHVSVSGNDDSDGSPTKPLKTIMAAANKALPGDVITVHAGIYREKITPPRGGNSDRERITYQAAKGEKVIITGSEPAKGWEKVYNDTWKLTLPNTFFGASNPFDEQIYGSWYNGKGSPNHTGIVFLNGKRIRETFTLYDVLKPTEKQPYFYTEADGNGGPMLMSFEWIHPAGGKQMTSLSASVDGGEQSICLAVDRWPFGYLKDGSVLYFDGVDFGPGTDLLFFQAASLTKGGTVEMHLGNPTGELLGSSVVTNTGDWEKFSIFQLKMSRQISGKQNVCFVLRAPKIKSNGNTTIWAQFPNGVNPNKERVEITVRQEVFYPDKTGVNYITVRGFILENAATNWAPPSAEQPGLIGPRWAKGWVIENNIIRNSRCSGISIGRSTFGHAHHYQNLPPRIFPEPNGGQTEKQLIDYFQNASWTKDEAGFHIIRNNEIYECGQAGIVGNSGGAFSLIEGNEIHDICLDETFTGAEMAGIKLHFAIDAVIKDNHIYNTNRGLWLDWAAQGVQVIGNLFHDNTLEQDVFVEVSHGPTFFANNILLSKNTFYFNAQGIASVHNLMSGEVGGLKDGWGGGRKTFSYPAHETVSNGKPLNEGGDWQWYNNVLANTASFTKWAIKYPKNFPMLPIKYDGNVFTKGTEADAKDTKAVITPDFDTNVKLVKKADGWYLSINTAADWNKYNRKLVTTEVLDKAMVTNQPYVNPDGSSFKIDYDYFNHKRNASNPFPGPIEFTTSGEHEIKVWPK